MRVLRLGLVLCALGCGRTQGSPPTTMIARQQASQQASAPQQEMSPRQQPLGQMRVPMAPQRQLVVGRTPLASPSGGMLVSGLEHADVQEILQRVQRRDEVLDVVMVLEEARIGFLEESLEVNLAANRKASELTAVLQANGTLTATERIVGYHDGTLYKTSR